MLMSTRQRTDPVRLCWSHCIAIHPMHIQHLCSTCIDVLATAAEIERGCLVFEPFRWARSVGDLGQIQWDSLAGQLEALAPCPCPRLEETVSHVRLFVRLAVVHHQVWLAKSGSTLKLLGRCHLPQGLPPELSLLRDGFEQHLAVADRALRTGRAKLTHFQGQARQGYPLPALLWTILCQTSTCYQQYQYAIQAAYDLVDCAAQHVAQRETGATPHADRRRETAPEQRREAVA